MSIFKYFDVDDVRKIRESKRFQEEIVPQFVGEISFTVENEGKDLEVTGVHRDNDNDTKRGHRSALLLSCDPDRPYFGHWVRAKSVY